MGLKPKILAGQQTPKKNYEDHARKAMVSPPNMLAIEKERLEKSAVAHKFPAAGGPDDDLSGELPSIVETILENRKKLREASDFGRIYKVPFMKEKKKRMMRAPVQSEVKYGYGSGNLGLLPTPGLPLLTDDTKDVLLGSGFGDFRHYTLTKFMQTEFKMNDIPETKSRRQHSSSKSSHSLKEIFGCDSPSKKPRKSSEAKQKKSEEKAKRLEEKQKEKDKDKVKEKKKTLPIDPSDGFALSSPPITPVKK